MKERDKPVYATTPMRVEGWLAAQPAKVSNITDAKERSFTPNENSTGFFDISVETSN